eukprot:6878248-Prymnesium_polylepis.1
MAELAHASGAPTVNFAVRSEKHAAGFGIRAIHLNVHVHRNHLGGRQPRDSARCDQSVTMQVTMPEMGHMVAVLSAIDATIVAVAVLRIFVPRVLVPISRRSLAPRVHSWHVSYTVHSKAMKGAHGQSLSWRGRQNFDKPQRPRDRLAGQQSGRHRQLKGLGVVLGSGHQRVVYKAIDTSQSTELTCGERAQDERDHGRRQVIKVNRGDTVRQYPLSRRTPVRPGIHRAHLVCTSRQLHGGCWGETVQSGSALVS